MIKQKFDNFLSPFLNPQPEVEKKYTKYGGSSGYKTGSQGYSSGGYGPSYGGYGQSSGGYGSKPPGGYGVKSSGGYGQSSGGYGQSSGGYGTKSGGYGHSMGGTIGLAPFGMVPAGEICKPPQKQPSNAKLECNNNMCKAICMPNYQFPNGQTILDMKCFKDEWIIQGVEWDEIPSCERKTDNDFCFN